MTTRLEEVLHGQEANYILPFLWQRGEDEVTIRAEIARVNDVGIGAICVEARPHPDFLGPSWWHDFDIIMDEAKKRGMQVWVFDDDHFPTGRAAGQLVQAPAALRRQFLKEQHLDAIGPQANASFSLKPWFLAMGKIMAMDSAENVTPTDLWTEGEQIIVTAVQYPAFTHYGEIETLTDMSQPDILPHFSGTFRYETTFDWTAPADSVWLDLGEVYETAEVWVNGRAAGVRICPPYHFDISELIHSGSNSLVIDVTNTLAKTQRDVDFFSRFAPQEPSGLLGPIRLLT